MRLVAERAVRVTAGFLSALAVVACGGDGGAGPPGPTTSAASPATVAITTGPSGPATTATGAATTRVAGGSRYPNCPLTEQQVAAVIGEPMSVEHLAIGCVFRPAGDRLRPSVTYNPQHSVLSDPDVRREAGYIRPVAGVADEAYATDDNATGVAVAARDGNQWFEVTVDSSADVSTDEGLAASLAKAIADNN